MMKRVAAYCRVSTDADDQINSLENQRAYFARCIAQNPEWELAEIYADKGVTGTSVRGRAAFMRMIDDAQRGRFDLILTKEISRFARNTLDSVLYTRKLKEYGVGVIFMNDNINTLDADAELRLTIMSSIAQEESRKTSERVKWGQKRKMEQGVVFGRDLLGYDVKEGGLIINEAGAETVRLIFHKYVNEAKGTHVIARELRDAGTETSAYMKQWSNTAVLRVLRNEKYCGDLIQKKTFTPNYLNHEKKRNCGEEEYIVLRNHHAPVISRALFDKAQSELARRSPNKAQKIKYSNRYCFSGKIKCGICGRSYVPRVKTRKDNSIYKAWRCGEAAQNGKRHSDCAGHIVGCVNRCVSDEKLKLVLQQAVGSLSADLNAPLKRLCAVVCESVKQNNGNEGIRQMCARRNKLNRRQQLLLELYLNEEISRDEFFRLKQQNDMQKNALGTIETDASEDHSETVRRISEMTQAVFTGQIWDDVFYRALLDKMVIQENGLIDVYFRGMRRLRFYVCRTGGISGRRFDTSQGTEELAHLEMVACLFEQLIKGATKDEMLKAGFEGYFVEHGCNPFYLNTGGQTFDTYSIGSKGDAVVDLYEDMAAEQKARITYENLIKMTDDPLLKDSLKYLREREVVHFQRFGETLRLVEEHYGSKKIF